MHGNNPARDSIERALNFAVSEGLLRSWKRLAGYGASAKWEVEVNASVHSADGLGTYNIRTYAEGNLFCAALASARSGMMSKLQPQIDAWASLVGEYREAGSALRKTIDIMEAGHGSADAEHAALYSLCTSIAELLDVSFDSYVSTTDTTGEDDDE